MLDDAEYVVALAGAGAEHADLARRPVHPLGDGPLDVPQPHEGTVRLARRPGGCRSVDAARAPFLTSHARERAGHGVEDGISAPSIQTGKLGVKLMNDLMRRTLACLVTISRAVLFDLGADSVGDPPSLHGPERGQM